MQLDVQRYLELVENNNSICFFDLETTGREAEYDSIICGSIKSYHDAPMTFTVKQIGNDQKILKELKEWLTSFDVYVTYYGKGFDTLFLNTRSLKWRQPPLPPMLHLDMYFALRGKLILGRRSQGHIASWLRLPVEKMSVSADIWSEAPYKPKLNLPILVERCESDVTGLQQLYDTSKHLVRDLKQ